MHTNMSNMFFSKVSNLYLICLAILWNYDPASSRLENKAEYWKYEGETWTLPSEGSSGKIQAASGKVLGILGKVFEIATYRVNYFLQNSLLE